MSQESLEIIVSKRDVIGKGLGALRRDGQVPAVVHDHGQPSTVVQAVYGELQKLVARAGKNHVVTVKVDGGKNFTALIKDVSYEPRKHTISHVVFNAVKANEKVDAEVPVRIQFAEGDESTPAEQKGLIVLQNAETLQVEALPKDLPDALYVPAEKLVETGDQVTVADVIAIKGVTIKDDAETVVATVFEPSALAAANDAVGGDAEEETPAEESTDDEAAAPAAEASKE